MRLQSLQQRSKREHDTQEAWLKHIKALGEAEQAMVNIGADHINKLLAMSREIAAKGGGLNAASYSAPYPGSQTTLNIQQPSKAGGFLAIAAGTLLGVTGLGAAGGAMYALKDKVASPTPPVATAPAKPQEFDIKIQQIDGNLKVDGVQK